MKITDKKEILLEVLDELFELERKLWEGNDGVAAAGVVKAQGVVLDLLSPLIK
jgi:hypothetical protein